LSVQRQYEHKPQTLLLNRAPGFWIVS